MPAHVKDHASTHDIGSDDPFAHKNQHQNGGGDEINVAGLSGVLADAQTAAAHAASHQNGGGDEMSVAGLSGVLADAQTPSSHAASHQNGGGDEMSVAGLSGLLADPQTALSHSIEGPTHSFVGIANSQCIVKDDVGTAGGLTYSDGPDASTIGKRNVDGTFSVVDGVNPDEAVNKGQLDAATLANIYWTAAVQAAWLVGDTDKGGAPPVMAPGTDGWAYVVNNWGAGTYGNTGGPYTDGDVAWYEESTGQWNVCVGNVGGFVPATYEFYVVGPMGSGNSEWPGQELTRATADGAGGWSFGAVPVQADEGQTSTIVAEDAYFEGGSVTLDWNDGVNQDRQKSISAPQIHKDLKFLDGGDAVTGEFWHTTAAEHATLTGKITEISRLGLEFVSAAAIPTAAEVQANFGPNVWGVALGNLNEPYFVYGDADGLSGWGTGMGALL